MPSRSACITLFALITLAVPWYWPFFPELAARIWLGVPAWAAVAVLASAGLSCWAAWLLRKPWPDEDEEAS